MVSTSSLLSFQAGRTDRMAGAAVTLALHLALVLAWQLAGRPPPPGQEGSDEAMQWLTVPSVAPAAGPAPPVTPKPAAARAPRALPAPPPPPAPSPAPTRSIQPAASTSALPAAPDEAAATAVDHPAAAAAMSGAESILQEARRSAGAIDRALRKESRPLIVAPLDSPQIRMRAGMEHARAMAPPRMWEAPKVEELVNNTGDGARRTRVITGNRTYCITNRAPTTNVEMIEMHGRQRFTNCPSDEEPPKQQAWRTARD